MRSRYIIYVCYLVIMIRIWNLNSRLLIIGLKSGTLHLKSGTLFYESETCIKDLEL